jgi:hypothetical protein
VAVLGRAGTFSPLGALKTEWVTSTVGAVSFYGSKQNHRSWKPIESAPTDREVEVQAADQFGSYKLTFPCRLTEAGWVNTASAGRLTVKPTHWRECKPY